MVFAIVYCVNLEKIVLTSLQIFSVKDGRNKETNVCHVHKKGNPMSNVCNNISMSLLKKVNECDQ